MDEERSGNSTRWKKEGCQGIQVGCKEKKVIISCQDKNGMASVGVSKVKRKRGKRTRCGSGKPRK